MNEKWTYKKAGVDREKAEGAISKIWQLISKTFQFREGRIGQPLDVKGHYAGLLDIGGETQLALHVDNVGTKVLVAQRMQKFDTIGIDLVAMNANDLISVGAEPVALVDYLGLSDPRKGLVEEIMEGIVQGAEKSKMIVLGGESATVPEIVTGISRDSAFDLAGMSLGVIRKGEMITGDEVREGDLILGLQSNGIHSNGLTLARRLLFDVKGLSVEDRIEDTDMKVGEELLKPTKIYTPEVMQMLEECGEIHGIGHITGGAFTKMERLRRDGLKFELHMPKPPELFLRLQEIGNISMREMYKTYNMGVGLVVIAGKGEEEMVRNIAEEHGTKCYTLGNVKKGEGIHIETWTEEHIAF